MDSNDCILTINIIYNEKSFKLEIENLITIDELKTEIMNNFNIQDKDKENIKLFYKKEDKQIFISSEKELIENADCANPDNPKIDLNLLIEVHKEVIPLEEEGETPREFEENILENNNEDKDKELIKDNNIDINNNNNDNKYENLLKIIEDLKADIKILKEEHSNKFVKLKEENSEIRKENNEKFKSLELLQNEFYKFKDYIAESLAKNMESLNKKWEEVNEIQSKKINEIADEVNIIKNFEILSKNDDHYENKFNEMINPLRNEIKQKSDKIENLVKNVSSLENKFENQDLNKIINDFIIDNSNFKKSIKEDYNKICKENSEFKESLTKSYKANIEKLEKDFTLNLYKFNEDIQRITNSMENFEKNATLIVNKNNENLTNSFISLQQNMELKFKEINDKIANININSFGVNEKFKNYANEIEKLKVNNNNYETQLNNIIKKIEQLNLTKINHQQKDECLKIDQNKNFSNSMHFQNEINSNNKNDFLNINEYEPNYDIIKLGAIENKYFANNENQSKNDNIGKGSNIENKEGININDLNNKNIFRNNMENIKKFRQEYKDLDNYTDEELNKILSENEGDFKTTAIQLMLNSDKK